MVKSFNNLVRLTPTSLRTLNCGENIVRNFNENFQRGQIAKHLSLYPRRHNNILVTNIFHWILLLIWSRRCLTQAGATTFKYYWSFSSSASPRLRSEADKLIATQCFVRTKMNERERISLLQYYSCVIDAHNDAAHQTRYDGWYNHSGVVENFLEMWKNCKTQKCVHFSEFER